jgi:predicted RNA binding protein YcfA (HicA-like mRNA interferase family)
MGSKKDVMRVINEVASAGWLVERTRGGHFRLVAPGGQSVIAASTPSDPRALLNMKSRIKRIQQEYQQ